MPFDGDSEGLNSQINQLMPDNNMNPESELSQGLPLKDFPPQDLPSSEEPQIDVNTLALLLSILKQINQEKGKNAEPEDFIKLLENLLTQEQEDNNEVQEL